MAYLTEDEPARQAMGGEGALYICGEGWDGSALGLTYYVSVGRMGLHWVTMFTIFKNTDIISMHKLLAETFANPTWMTNTM